MSLSKNYAKALFEVALDEGSVETTLTQLKSVVPFFMPNAPSARLFFSPISTTVEKIAALEVLEKKLGFSPLVGKFLKIILRRGRAERFPSFVKDFETFAVEKAGGSAGVVVSSVEMSAADVAEVEAAFQKKLGKKVLLRPEVDSNLIAGVRVVVDGVSYDRSIRSQLDRLQMKFLDNALN